MKLLVPFDWLNLSTCVHLLSTYYVPDTLLGAKARTVFWN